MNDYKEQRPPWDDDRPLSVQYIPHAVKSIKVKVKLFRYCHEGDKGEKKYVYY
jgi:hypothetical protein